MLNLERGEAAVGGKGLSWKDFLKIPEVLRFLSCNFNFEMLFLESLCGAGN